MMTNHMLHHHIKHRQRIGADDRIFYVLSGCVICLLLLAVCYPLLNVLSSSFSSGKAVSSGQVMLLPVEPSLEGYKAVFRNPNILRAYLNTILYTVTGTFINIAMTLLCAYPMSRREMKGRGLFMLVFVFTMLFSGGMIPTYMLIKNLRMLDTFWVMVVPGALSVYSMIIARTYMQNSIPGELYEAASLDGCGYFAYFFKIILPLSGAIVAVTALFAAVGHWNAYFSAMMYLNSRHLAPLQVVLRDILIMNQVDLTMTQDPEGALKSADIASVLKYSLIVVSTAPILCLYPFIQRYFIAGMTIGAIKG